MFKKLSSRGPYKFMMCTKGNCNPSETFAEAKIHIEPRSWIAFACRWTGDTA